MLRAAERKGILLRRDHAHALLFAVDLAVDLAFYLAFDLPLGARFVMALGCFS